MAQTQTPDRTNLSTEVFATLKDRILHWNYPPGHRFTEEQLCAEFDVSRSPVREALRMLVENGLVEKVPHRGYSVRQPDSDEIQELYDVRLALESYIVERVAKQGLERGLAAQLRQTWQGVLKREPSENADVANADERFHEALARATGNQTLVGLLHGINERLRFARLTDINAPGRIRSTCRQHLLILERIAAQDPDGAREAVRANVEQGRKYVEAAFKDVLAGAFREQRAGRGLIR
jgi:DNA-binding GntR family transcriptional regulator